MKTEDVDGIEGPWMLMVDPIPVLERATSRRFDRRVGGWTDEPSITARCARALIRWARENRDPALPSGPNPGISVGAALTIFEHGIAGVPDLDAISHLIARNIYWTATRKRRLPR